MNAIKTAIPDVIILEPKVFGDERGFFMESFSAKTFAAVTGVQREFVQDNHSKSARGVLRGLHYQLQQPQGKLVRVVRGAVFDVAVDMRRSSPTFGKWVGEILSEDNKRQLWVPEGFAHGFVTLTPDTEVIYKVTDTYSREHDRSIRFDDPDIAVKWPGSAENFQLSDKDKAAPYLNDAEVFS